MGNMIVWPSLTEKSRDAVLNTMPQPTRIFDDKTVRMLKCTGKGCRGKDTKHREDEMWTYIINPFMGTKSRTRRFCKECAKNYDGKYMLERPDYV